MKTRTQLWPGHLGLNHNQSLRVNTRVTAGKLASNHNQPLQS
jgi:hypothetical protein